MRLTFCRLLTVLLALAPLPCAFPAGAEGKILPTAGEILPPFGLNWGADARVVEEAVRAAGGRVCERLGATGEERWTVEGIAQDGLQRVLFSFSGARLAGVELQYGKAEWDAKTYDDFMLAVRAGLAAEHGAGRMLARERTLESNGVLKSTLGYAWSRRAQSVALIYFSAQDERNLFRLISLHYAGRPQPQLVSRS